MSEKIKATAQDEVERVRKMTEDAARSGAYLYPFRGIIYFLAHRSLWSPLLHKLVPSLTLGGAVLAGMFFFTYLPQVAVLALFEGPVAPVSTILLVLSESSTLFNFLSKGWLVKESLVDTFDGTLVARGMTTLVQEGRVVKAGSDPIGKLGKMIKTPFERLSPTALIKYCLYLPLNFIPVVGTVLFIIMQGKRLGPHAHARYFQLKGYNSRQRDDVVEKNRGAYTSFGVAAAVLELVPIAGIFFAFTNNVGAALWAADMEQKTTTAPGLRDAAKKAE